MNRRPRRIITVDDERLAERCARGRIVLIDDDPEVLAALGALLTYEGYATEAYESAASYLGTLEGDMPQFAGPVCLLCDVNMPMLSGLELQRRLLEMNDVPLLLMSGVSGAEEAASAFRAGAIDFLVKPIAADTLIAAVGKALQVSAQRQEASMLLAGLRARAQALSERERSVVRLVVRGMKNQAIADTLGIALRTVKLHRQRGMEKLGAASTADLVRLVDQLTL